MLLTAGTGAWGESLLNFRFAADANAPKTGPAAVGQSVADYWNLYSRDVPGTGGTQWRATGEIAGLKWADGTASPAVLRVENAAGAYYTGSTDPMFFAYLYPLGRTGNVTLTLTEMPAGECDIYVYAHGAVNGENSVIGLSVGGGVVTNLATTSAPGWNTTNWQAGVQYVVFSGVKVGVGEAVRVVSQPGMNGLAVINGMQVRWMPSVCAPRRALATARVDNGFLVEATVVDGGCGYTNAPVVELIGGGGSGAVLRAVVRDGVVRSIEVENPGRGYATAPRVWVSAPPHPAALSVQTTKVRVTLDLVLGHKYQLESSADCAVWVPAGAEFTATVEEVTQEFDTTETGAYFRVREVP